jgi:ABC-type multidrug transport system permease subunit
MELLAYGAFGIFVLLKLISLAPFVGWLIIILSVCIAFGSILLNINWKNRQKSIATV